MPKPIIPKKSPETRFWEWFQQNDDRLFDFERNQGPLIEEIARELHRIHRSLSFEISSVQHGKRQIIISADGHRDAFPVVVKLGDAAPNLARWEVIKFRPHRSEPCIIGIGDMSFSSDAVQFTLEPEEGKVGVTLYLGNEAHFDEQVIGHIGFLLLDYTLGEYDVETLVGSVQFVPQNTPSKEKKRFLPELPALFDTLAKSLAN
ncbi:MAG: hypothetical protein NTZ35_09225 [Ignavibacteriales bacterium]|nr:hypothetical protein [Ignavibacteriales bacterium]